MTIRPTDTALQHSQQAFGGRMRDESNPVPVAHRGKAAIGAVAVGALAVGAVALGALAVGRLAVGRARIGRLEIDELIVRKVRGPETRQGSSSPSGER